jgi:hypothetical protein
MNGAEFLRLGEQGSFLFENWRLQAYRALAELI